MVPNHNYLAQLLIANLGIVSRVLIAVLVLSRKVRSVMSSFLRGTRGSRRTVPICRLTIMFALECDEIRLCMVELGHDERVDLLVSAQYVCRRLAVDQTDINSFRKSSVFGGI
jgi:hypothetical protein